MEQKVITVTKTASEQFAANRVRIAFTANGEAKKYAAAIDGANASTAEAVAAFSDTDGISVKSRGINVTPVCEGNKTVGYRATQSFYAEFDFSPEILSKAVEILSGLNVEWHVSFKFKDNGESKELLKRAVEQAKTDAQAIATAAGVKIGGLSKVEYAASDTARPMMLRSAVYSDGAIEPSEITLSETVVCSWEIA